MISFFRIDRRRVDLVSENVFGLRLGDRQVEPSQQLSQGFALSAYHHGQAVVASQASIQTPLPPSAENGGICSISPQTAVKRVTPVDVRR